MQTPYRRPPFRIAWLACAAALAGPAFAACEVASGPARVRLLELYTSEGCDSCPPADRWLSALVRGGTPEVAALAFHVDYWDRLGWKDRYADPAHTARQRERARAAGARTIYTPQVMIDGRDHRAWRRTLPAADPPQARIRLSGDASLRVEATLDAAAHAAAPALYVAVTEDGLSSVVTAGENRGRTLNHDAVVRHLTGPIAFDARGRAAVTVPTTLAVPIAHGRAAWVAFVQDRADSRVLQALRVPFATCPPVPSPSRP